MQPLSDGAVGVDVHAHGVPRGFLAEVAATGLADVEIDKVDDGYIVSFPGRKPLRPVSGSMLDFEQRICWLDSQQMQSQLVATWLDIQGQELSSAVGQQWVRCLNNALAEELTGSGRLRGMATLHLADGKAAARELTRAAQELRLPGCMIPTHLPGGYLSDPQFDPLWEAAQGLRVPITLHPPTKSPSTALFDRRPEHKGLYGRLIDTTLVAADLIAAGVLDRFPALEIVLVHGGGFLPYQSGRFQREIGDKMVRADGTLPPDYMARFSYDTVLMSQQAIALLFGLVGHERVVIGSDYGAGPQYKTSGTLTDALIEATDDPTILEAVLRGNAERLYPVGE